MSAISDIRRNKLIMLQQTVMNKDKKLAVLWFVETVENFDNESYNVFIYDIL